MRKFTALIIIVVMSLCGCSKEETPTIEYSGRTTTYDVQISDTDYIVIEVPVESELQLQDGYSHFQFANDIIIDVSNSQTTLSKYDTESGLYISDTSLQLNVDDKCILVSCSGIENELMKTYLQNIKRVRVSTGLYKESMLDRLPEYLNVDMVMNGEMYMPDGPTVGDWLGLNSQLYVDGPDAYLQCTIYDYNVEDIKDKLLTQVLCNTGSDRLNEWYQDSNILYMRAGNHCIITKRLAYNCTYVYSCTADMLDYALKGANKVHGQNVK